MIAQFSYTMNNLVNRVLTFQIMMMKMKPAEFIALSASSMMLTALGIDIMLPAFGAIREHYHLDQASSATAQIVTFFFLGQVAQVIFGALSDRFGRLAILRLGFPLYIVGGVAATFAPDLATMFVSRFVAGVGASAVFTTTIAGVRDRFVGDQMARVMSLILTVFLSTPVFAPFLGLAILSVYSWHVVFLTPPVFAMIVFVWSFRLEESLPREKRSSLQFSVLFESAKKVLGNIIFLRYTAITTILFAGLSSWVSSSEYIVSEVYKRPELFAWVFAGIGLFMAVSSLTNSKLSIRFGARITLKALLVSYTLVAAFFLSCTLVYGNPPQIIVFVIGVSLLMGINLAVEPNSSALALEPMGDMAGLASSLYGTVFFFAGAALGSIISLLMTGTVLPLIIGFFIIGIITCILALTDRRPSLT
jgi:DHA1 family bicyclomycin/chloramphenicol resistance-like MFS transporter